MNVPSCFNKNAIDSSTMDQPGGALVVKIGGSLLPEAGDIVSFLEKSGRSLLIVPGGGPFARLVRSMNLPDESAHWMAILAMDQFGWYMAAGGLPVTHDLALPGGAVILLPFRILRDRDPLPHTWDVTSDTIAAWVASELGTDLLLLKSVDGITTKGDLVPRVTEPMSCEEVDPCLIPFALSHGVRTTILYGREAGRVRDFLDGKKVRGTVIEPRL
ncbi:MAG TPA: uridylate kinase [Methanomicrobiales archaeon]|nr:uridylate kinase [Methanomicrobiales archaeon]